MNHNENVQKFKSLINEHPMVAEFVKPLGVHGLIQTVKLFVKYSGGKELSSDDWQAFTEAIDQLGKF